MSVTLRKITEEDLEQIMRWRMDPEITRYMNTDPKLTLEGQKKWFAKVQQDPDVSYWIIQIDGTPAGVINYTGLMNPAGDLGWAYYVGEKKLRSIQAALALEMSMYDHAFLDLGKNAVYSDVFTLNQGVIQLHKICGCEVVEEKKACVEKNGTAYDVTFMRMTADHWKEIRDNKNTNILYFHKISIRRFVPAQEAITAEDLQVTERQGYYYEQRNHDRKSQDQ